MAKKAKKGKNRLDKYYHLAKEQGYRSRAAFKLIQLNRKYNFLSNAHALLDLCAAPGGWLQVAAKTMPMASLIIGVDLVPIKPIRGVKTLIGDITTQQCRAALKKEAGGSMMDVVVHDGAPNVGGAWQNEAYTQSALVLDSLKLAVEFLSPKGTFVTKVFRSKDYNALLYAFNQLFDKVESTKPTASRNASAEIFVVCQGFKAPAKIDSRLLDPKFLFQDVSEPKKVMGPDALMRQKITQRRWREGYEEGLSTTFKAAPALAFIASDTPVEMLGQVTRLALDGAGAVDEQQLSGAFPNSNDTDHVKDLADRVRRHPATSAEIWALCEDLQVLGRAQFKELLRWRLAVRKALTKELEGGGDEEDEEAEGNKGKADAAAAGTPADSEAALLAEMAALKAKVAADAKREKKKRRESKQKARVRSAQMAASEGITEDTAAQGEQLFSLNLLKGQKREGLGRLVDVSAPAERDMQQLAQDSEEDEGDDVDGSEADSDDEALRYEAELEEALEDSYRQFLERKGIREDKIKEKRKRLGKDGELDEDLSDADDVGAANIGQGQTAGSPASDENEGAAGLLVGLDDDRIGVPKTGAAMAAQWFKQDVFADPDLMAEDDDQEEGAEALQPAAKKVRKEQQQQLAQAAPLSDDGNEDGDNEEERGTAAACGVIAPAESQSKEGDFEVVPLKADDSDASEDSEDEFDLLDDQGKAEVLALAKRMLRRSEKESILDTAYNKRAFHDDGLPRWFLEDELWHMQPIIPVTKEEVEAEKARLKAIDARPIRKVAEAKGRKRRRMLTKLAQAREKAESIANQEDVPAKSKMREIERLYARARAVGKDGKGKKGSKAKGGKRDSKRKGPPLDKRMKKEKRAEQRLAKVKGRKGKGGGGVGKGCKGRR